MVTLMAPKGTSSFVWQGETCKVNPKTGLVQVPDEAEAEARQFGFGDVPADLAAAEGAGSDEFDLKKASAAQVRAFLEEKGVEIPAEAKTQDLRNLAADFIAGKEVKMIQKEPPVPNSPQE